MAGGRCNFTVAKITSKYKIHFLWFNNERENFWEVFGNAFIAKIERKAGNIKLRIVKLIFRR